MTARRFAALFVCGLLAFWGVPGARAQRPAGARQPVGAERLQTPAAFLGYALGERFTPYARVAAYARHVAAASPRARLTRYGTTNEGRPLLLLTLSAPQNLARLEAIRRAHLRRTGLGGRRASGSAQEEPDDKAVVWLSYNVHGDEASSTEAAMKTLYALADPQNARTGGWLSGAVVLLDPCLNPDGRARYVQWYRQTRGARPNARPEAREHHPDWPGGRTNHYLFDLNRDWAWATQRETRARLEQYHRWMPHVHVDFHEMGAGESYYFAPGAEPMHEALTPFQRDFQKTMGRANARVFDREGWLYFTGEVYDLFYPGYGDTWPLFNGAVGMTYEQAGGGRAGLVLQTGAADSLSLKERIAHHYATSLTTVETAARERSRLARAFADYYRTARSGLPGETAAYVVSGANEDRRRALAALLDRQRIRYGYAAQGAAARGTRYGTGRRERFQIATGDLVVPAAQPKAHLARVLFDRRPALSDSITYDITAWALPYAFGMEAHALASPPGVRTRSTPPPGAGSAAPRSEAPRSEARAQGSAQAGAPYAYLAAWQSVADARVLAQLLKRGVHVRFARAPFEAGGRRWGRGTLVITRADNERLGRRFVEVVTGAAGAARQRLHPLRSGFTAGGPDLGSGTVASLKKPTVALLSGPGLAPYAVGEVWHFFDRRLRYPVTLLRASDVRDGLEAGPGAGVLDDVDVLVLPSGDYEAILPKEARVRLRQWVERGGRLVAMGEAAGVLAEADGFALERKTPAQSAAQEAAQEAAQSADDEAAAPPRRRYERRERAAASARVPGAVFRARLDPTHPLAYGYAPAESSGDLGAGAYYTLKRGAAAFAPLTAGGSGWNVAVLPADGGGTPVSGFAGARAQRRLGGTLVFGVEEIGQGRAVYLVDDPLFRGFWQGGMLLFSNAVFLVGQ